MSHRFLAVAAVVVSLYGAAPASAEPGMPTPPAAPCQSGTVSSFDSPNGGAWMCNVSGGWEWQDMSFDDWWVAFGCPQDPCEKCQSALASLAYTPSKAAQAPRMLDVPSTTWKRSTFCM